MTVAAAKELRDKRTFRFTKGGTRTYQRVFLVVTDTKTDGPQAILASEGLPQHLDPYSLTGESDGGALAVGVGARQLSKTPLHWHVTVMYSSDVDKEKEEKSGGSGGGDDGGGDVDPFGIPSVVTFGVETFRVVASSAFDILGSQVSETLATIENSAKQPFDPPAMKDDARPIMTVERNELFFDPKNAIDFQNTINDDDFAGGNPGQVKVKAITATKEIAAGNPDIKFWRVTYVFAYARDTWVLKLLDHGTRKKDPNDPALWVPHTEDGVVTDVKLDGAGNELTEGDPVFLEFDIYEPRTFAELGLNTLIDDALNVQV